MVPAALLALCLPLTPAPVSDDESQASEAAVDELAGEAESSLGDVPRVTDLSWHFSKVSEGSMGPGEAVAQDPKGQQGEGSDDPWQGRLGLAASGLQCLLQEGCDAAASSWLCEQKCTLGMVTLPPSGFPPPPSWPSKA